MKTPIFIRLVSTSRWLRSKLYIQTDSTQHSLPNWMLTLSLLDGNPVLNILSTGITQSTDFCTLLLLDTPTLLISNLLVKPFKNDWLSFPYNTSDKGRFFKLCLNQTLTQTIVITSWGSALVPRRNGSTRCFIHLTISVSRPQHLNENLLNSSNFYRVTARRHSTWLSLHKLQKPTRNW